MEPETSQDKNIQIQKELQYEQLDAPQQYYDSDVASVKHEDFLSDNEPPKDIAQQRKQLFKEKFLHVYKTIISLGYGIDKPARYDRITLRYKQLQTDNLKKQISISHQQASKILSQQKEIQYNLGYQHIDLERLIISMRPKQIALFEMQFLGTKETNEVKMLQNRRSYLVQVIKWTTVIDIEADRKFMKYVVNKGEGPNRVSAFDEATFTYTLQFRNKKFERKYSQVTLEQNVVDQIPKTIWMILSSMKNKEKVFLDVKNVDIFEYQRQQILQAVLKELEIQIESVRPQKRQEQKKQEYQQQQQKKQGHQQHEYWHIQVQVLSLYKIDDLFLDGRILKKTLLRGVSTAKPDSGSLMYYALKFLDEDKIQIYKDPFFDSDWWQDFGKLDILGCRKNYMDDFSISKLLKNVFYRMKPAEIAVIECRDSQMFTYGTDYQQLSNLYKKQNKQLPKTIRFVVRVYNFTEGRTCFNMQLPDKILQARRRKVVAIKLLNEGKIKKALKRFQSIVSFFSEGLLNQEAYQEKISGLMNSILCHMKEKNYTQMVPLCDEVIKQPEQGKEISDITIHGPRGYKVQRNGNTESQQKEQDNTLIQKDQFEQQKKQQIIFKQNPKIIDKCLYRKALALTQLGQHQQSLKILGSITEKSQETSKLKDQVQKRWDQYQIKSKKMYKNMFQA